LNKILLTHAHLDHILGLGGLVSTFVRWEDVEEIEVWGGKPALDRVEDLIYGIVLRDRRNAPPVHLVDLKPGPFIRAKKFTVEAFPVTHRGPGNFGFIFKEDDHQPFLADKAEALGIPAGPERGQLVRGESITLEDGTLVTPEMVLGEVERGAKLVHIGDTGRTDNLRQYVADADMLVIESTFLEVEADVANAFGHITARQAATLALETGVKTLVLTHISRRYRERDVIDEAQQVFPNTYVARDFDQFSVLRGRPVEKVDPDQSKGDTDDQ
jgi:ribonuclease Z